MNQVKRPNSRNLLSATYKCFSSMRMLSLLFALVADYNRFGQYSKAPIIFMTTFKIFQFNTVGEKVRKYSKTSVNLLQHDDIDDNLILVILLASAATTGKIPRRIITKHNFQKMSAKEEGTKRKKSPPIRHHSREPGSFRFPVSQTRRRNARICWPA